MSSRLAPIGKNRTISTQRYTFTFQPNSAEYNAQEVEAPGKISDISAPSGTKVLKAIASSPYQQQVSRGDSVGQGDIITVELDATPTAKETVEVVISFSDISETKTLPEDLGGNAQYLYIVNHDDATVSCVDTVQGAEIATIPMPANYSTGNVNVKCVYRFYDKEVFVFYNDNDLNFIIIDADPASANFNSIKSGPTSAGVGGVKGERVGYVQTKDYFVTVDEKNYSVFDKNQVFLSGFRFVQNWGKNSANNSFLLGSYVFGGNTNSSRQVVDTSKTGYSLVQDFGNSKSGAGRYNPINGLIYWVERGAVRVVEPHTWTVIASLSAGTDRGSCDIDLDNNIVLAVSTGNNLTKIDADTNTVIGSENPGAPMDQIFWSRASGLFYTRKRGTDQLFVYDATKSPGSMKVNQITVGNTPLKTFQNNPCACINQIML